MNTMLTKKIVPFLMAPMFAVGCAAGGDDAAQGEGNFTAASTTSADFTASVGAVVIGGKRLCTAALVDVDASASINSVSLSGRQVVMGGACIGKLKNGFVGGAVFVSEANSVSLATPIISIDFESQAAAGLAVGILSDRPADTQPMRILGADASINAGVSRATILRADENGLLVAASAEAHAGVKFDLVTKCTEWHFAAKAGVKVGAGFSLSDDGLGAMAIVKVNGELRFAANVDGGCIVREVQDAARLAVNATLEAGNTLGDAVNLVGASKDLAAVYALPAGKSTVQLHLYRNTNEIKLNGQGRISADTSTGLSCSKDLGILGPCRLRGSFSAGQTIDLTIDTHLDILPDHPDAPGKTRVFVTLDE
jgi:hypothetical protein